MFLANTEKKKQKKNEKRNHRRNRITESRKYQKVPSRTKSHFFFSFGQMKKASILCFLQINK